MLVVGGLCSQGSWEFSSVQLLSRVQLFATPWTTARRASLSLLKLMSIESVMPSNHLILCRLLLLLPSIFPSIRIFSNGWALHIRWPKYWSFSFSISPSNEYSELIFFRMDWLDLLAVQGTLSYVKQITSPGSMHETGCSGLVQSDDPEGWDGEGSVRGVQDGEHMYTHGWFMSMYGKSHYDIVK